MDNKTVRQIEGEMLLLIRDQIILYSETLENLGKESISLFQLKLKTEQLLAEMGLKAPEGNCGSYPISIE